MDWNSILSFIVGGIVATIPIIINNIFQAKEKEKDRLEQRRINRIRAKEKWMEQDILKIMDTVGDIRRLFVGLTNAASQVERVIDGRKKGEYSDEEYESKMKKLGTDFVIDLTTKYEILNDVLITQVYSFDEEVVSAYEKYNTAFQKQLMDASMYFKKRTAEGSNPINDPFTVNWNDLSVAAGEFHGILRERVSAQA
jgi:hypothetical protein